MSLVIVNGEKYELWVPDTEEEFEKMVKEHAKEIFGENSEFFDIKKKIKSESGIGSIPDGYLIHFNAEPPWFIVEIELSTHDLYDHIVKQISRFTIGIKNPESRRKIVDLIYEEIKNDALRYEQIKNRIKSHEIYNFITKLFAKDPSLLIIIDKKTKELEDISDHVLRLETIVREFKTFVKKDEQISKHLHFIETLTEITSPIPPETITEIKDVIRATIAGRQVILSRDQILKAAKDPKINEFKYREWVAEIEGKYYPVKGLISLATGISVSEFASHQVRPLLEKLGFNVKKIK
jgi:hypothetical protein